MATYYSPKTTTDGLSVCLDAANIKSYVSGSNSWYDLSGNNVIGTLTNGPAYTSSFGGMIIFDGANDYIDTGKTATQLGIYDNSYTLFSLCYFKSVTNDHMIFGTNQTNLRQGMHNGVRSGGWYFGHYSSDTGGGTAVANTWYGLAWVFNKTNNAAQIYVNGNLVVNGSVSSFIGTTNLFIASSWAAANVNVAYASVYNRVLSQNEILQNYNAIKNRVGLS